MASGADEYELDFVFARSEKFEETGGYRSKGDQWEMLSITWDNIFAILGSSILQTNSQYWSVSRELASHVNHKTRYDLMKKYPNSKFTNFRISSDCADTIMLQLRALKLIELDEDKRWQLTPYGDNYLVSLRGVPKGGKRAGE